jgi:hypothetical protein
VQELTVKLQECWSNLGLVSVFPGTDSEKYKTFSRSQNLFLEVCDFLEMIVTFCYCAALLGKKVHNFSGKSETFLEDSDFPKSLSLFTVESVPNQLIAQ